MDGKEILPEYEYHGARSLVLLHERHLGSFVKTWKKAKAQGVTLPVTKDPAYVSFEALLAHVLSCARRYMVWACESLNLPDPGIGPAPEVDAVESEVEAYLEHLAKRWRLPLAGVTEEKFYRPEHDAWWKVKYCVDAMLEHAVMHPLRHEFQLEELMKSDK